MKKLTILLLSIALVVVLGVLLVACNNNTTYYISTGNDAIAQLCDEDDTSSLTDNNVKAGGSVTLGVTMYNYYNPDTLKVFANGTEVAFTKSANYDNSAILSETQLVGTVTFTNVTADIDVTFECEEKQMTFSFANQSEEQVSGALAEFRLPDGSTMRTAITTPNYQYITTYSEYAENAGIVVSGPKNFKYQFNIYDEQSGNTINFIADMSANFAENIVADRNKYLLTVNGDLQLDNIIRVNGQAISYQEFWFSNSTGDVLKINKPSDKWGFIATELSQVSLSFNVADGVDVSQAKIFVNDTEVQLTEGKYNFTNLFPIDYVADQNLTNTNYVTFTLRVEGVDCVEATTLHKFTVNAECDVEFGGHYYSDGNTAWYEGTAANPRVAFRNIEQLATAPTYKITITKGEEAFVFEKSEYEEQSCIKSDFIVGVGSTTSDGTTTIISSVLIDLYNITQDLEIAFE